VVFARAKGVAEAKQAVAKLRNYWENKYSNWIFLIFVDIC